MDDANEVRQFWFSRSLEEWFSPALDAEIRKRFAGLTERAASGELDHWANSPRRRLALVLLLDQFPRNLYRGTAKAFAQDAQALQVAEDENMTAPPQEPSSRLDEVMQALHDLDAELDPES